ncbi:MAG: cytochrome c biogenesis heme-transporting ATPase CcmA, partial [Limnohabitans sp.]
MSALCFEVQEACIERAQRTLFQPVSFALQAGQALHLQGDNGAGKTSLLRALCGLSPLSQGVVRWCGELLPAAKLAFAKEVFYLGHALGLKDELSALENLQTACAIANQALKTDAAVSALQAQGLNKRMHLPLRVLSQGQKRRVALARLQVSAARLWLLDEPWVALDQSAQSALTELLRSHVARGGLLLFT